MYKGKLRKSGQTVAVKVQRPGVRESIALDVYILRFLAGQQVISTSVVSSITVNGSGCHRDIIPAIALQLTACSVKLTACLVKLTAASVFHDHRAEWPLP